MIFQGLNDVNAEFKFYKHTQIVNMDIDYCNQLYDLISKYFSNYKYTDEDLEKYNDYYPIVLEEGREVSRNKYQCIGISNYEEVDKILEYKKNSILMNYHKQKIQTVELQNEIDKLEKIFLDITEKIQNSYSSELNIRIKDIVINSDSILNKEIIAYIGNEMNCGQKICHLINLLIEQERCNTQEYLLYLQNVDTYVTVKQFEEIVKKCKESEYITLISSVSDTEYIDYKEMDRALFIEKGNIKQIPSIHILQKKVNKNILSDQEFSQAEIYEFLKFHIKELITEKYTFKKEYALIFESLKVKELNDEKDIFDMENMLII